MPEPPHRQRDHPGEHEQPHDAEPDDVEVQSGHPRPEATREVQLGRERPVGGLVLVGVRGQSNDGRAGVLGESTAGVGGTGLSTRSYGVQGVSDEGTTTPVADVTPAATTAVESSSSGSLPFTGLDVGILAIVAVALTGTGLLLRRLTAHGVTRS